MIYLVTSNKDKISQWKKIIPNFLKIKEILYEIPEEKIDNSELVLLKKLIHLKEKNFPNFSIAEDRALYLKNNLPGPNIKAFIKDEHFFIIILKEVMGF